MSESVNGNRPNGDLRPSNARSAAALAIAKKIKSSAATSDSNATRHTNLIDNHGMQQCLPPSRSARITRMGPSKVLSMKPQRVVPKTRGNTPQVIARTLTKPKPSVHHHPRPASDTQLPSSVHSRQPPNKPMSTAPRPKGKPTVSALSKAFGRNAGSVRSNFVPPGHRTGNPIQERSRAKTTPRAKPKPKSKLAARFGNQRSNPTILGSRPMSNAIRQRMPLRPGATGKASGRGRMMLRPGAGQARPSPVRAPLNPGLRLEDLYADESDDWIVEDEMAEDWRSELKGTGFDYEKYKHVEANDAMVSSSLQVRKEEAHAARIAAMEDQQEQKRLEMLENDDEEEEDDEYDEVEDFIDDE